jgi:hypothetical protein
MRSSSVIAALATVLFAGVLVASAAEQIDNPQYKAWSSYGVGSSQTLSGEISGGGANMKMEAVHTLVEKSDTQLVVEVSGTMDVAGQKHALPTHKQVIAAKVDPADVQKIGTEQVTAAGKTWDCTIYEGKDTSAAGEGGTAKVWVNPDVPGGTVKMSGNGAQGTVTFLLKSFEKK